MIPAIDYSEAQRVFIQNTLDGEYDDNPGNAPAIRRSLRNALQGMYRASREGNGHGYLRHLNNIIAARYTDLDCLTAEDFVVLNLLVAPALAHMAEIVGHMTEILNNTASLQLTRTMQSPALRERYGLAAGQQRPLPL